MGVPAVVADRCVWEMVFGMDPVHIRGWEAWM